MALHTINLASNSETLQSVFQQLAPNDVVIFINKGTSIAKANSPWAPTISLLKGDKSICFFLLAENSEVRDYNSDVLLIDYPAFVKLAAENKKIVNWY